MRLSARRKPVRAAKTSASQTITQVERAAAERFLAQLGYWVINADGRWDEGTRQALLAFQKYEGLPPTGMLTRAELDAMRQARRPQPRNAEQAPQVEIDLEKQLLWFVNEAGGVEKVLPISSGNGREFRSEGWTRDAITPPGKFTIQKKIPGWHKSALGVMYYPSYVMGGIAIHGSTFVPAYPDSHGCIRVPLFAAKQLYEHLPVGTTVTIYAAPPAPPAPVEARQEHQAPAQKFSARD